MPDVLNPKSKRPNGLNYRAHGTTPQRYILTSEAPGRQLWWNWGKVSRTLRIARVGNVKFRIEGLWFRAYIFLFGIGLPS